MSESLKDTLADMSQFISLEAGDSFTGVYRGFKRVPNKFDTEKESLEFTFEINGNEKTMTSMSLPKFLVDAEVNEGDTVTVTKVSKKGNTIQWAVKKHAVKAKGEATDILPEHPGEKSEVNEADLKAAGL